MRLILVRHGQTPSNVGNHLDTDRPGADLTALGRRQADALVPTLGGDPTPSLGASAIEAVHVSTLVRTQQTARPLAGHLGLAPGVHDGLREIAAGDLEMANDEASVLTYLRIAHGWIDGDLAARMPGGESGFEVLERFDAAVETIAASGVGVAVAVSHGAVIRVWSSLRCPDLPGQVVARRPLPNTGAVVLDGSPGAWRLVAWHDTPVGGAHLEREPDGPAGDELPPA